MRWGGLRWDGGGGCGTRGGKVRCWGWGCDGGERGLQSRSLALSASCPPARGQPSPTPRNPPPSAPRIPLSPARLRAATTARNRAPHSPARRALQPEAGCGRPSRKLRAAARGGSARRRSPNPATGRTARVPEAGAALSRVGVPQMNSLAP